MASAKAICDATDLSSGSGTITVLDFLTERVTVREMIRTRVYQEVKDYNTQPSKRFYGFVQPTEAENTVNGYELSKPRLIDWEEQFKRAIAAFNNNGFIILINNEQAADLNDEITISPDTTVTFLKLIPLVGG